MKKTLKKKKRRSRKNLKNEQKEKRRIQGKPNNNNFNLIYIKKYTLLENTVSKK